MTDTPSPGPSEDQREADRRFLLETLDQQEALLREIIAHPHYVVRDDEVVYDPATGQPIRDPAPALAAERDLAEIRQQRDEILLREQQDTTENILRLAAEIARRAASSGEDADPPPDH